MLRRDFLKLCAGAGVGLRVMGAARPARAAQPYTGPVFIMVHAGGGWDTSYLCDPKGGVAGDRSSINQLYAANAISSAGNIRYAPVNATLGGVEIYSNQRFFSSHGAKTLVINGVDCSTNNHDAGTRYTWSGRMGEGHPALAAVIAAGKTGNAPPAMAYVSNGGFDATQGIIPVTRTGSAWTLMSLAHPNRLDPMREDSGTFHSDATLGRIRAAQAGRLAALQGGVQLPSRRQSLAQLFAARADVDGLQDLSSQVSALPKDMWNNPKLVSLEDFADLNAVTQERYRLDELQEFMQQSQLCMMAFKAGLCVTANLHMGGFDTHGDHDRNQTVQMMKLLRGLDFIWSQAEALGVANRLVVAVGSEFGRTPVYNDQNGKDHWPVTSMMLMGAGVPGNKVVGATHGDVRATVLDPVTLQPSATGTVLKPEHVNRALRKLAGVDQSSVAQQFPLAGVDLPLLG